MDDFNYLEFIENILNTRGRFNCGDEYHERHHITPRCIGGTNSEENLIDLFAREHFIAHKLLAEENPDNNKIVYGWTCMAFMKNDYQNRYEITAEEYEKLKKIQSELHRKRKMPPVTEETRKKMSISQKARFENEEERQKYKEMHSGEKSCFYGKHHSEETKRKQREYKKGEFNPNYGKRYSEEEKQHLSELLSGENNPNYGKPRSEETRKKISDANKNPSEKTRQKMRNAKIGIYDGANNPKARTVICLETNIIYGAVSVASKRTGILSKSIGKCCRNERGSAGGYTWKYINDITKKDGTIILGALSLGLITEHEVLKQLNNTK